MTLTWVRQEHVNGCVIASLAMVLGRTYQSVHDELAPQIWHWDNDAVKGIEDHDERQRLGWKKGNDFSKNGVCLGQVYRWLEERGFATQLRWAWRWGHERVREWPPKPFAPVHICDVMTVAGSHAVVMTAEGKILDPNRAPGTWPESFSYYGSVSQVCGIWKVGDAYDASR